MFRRTCAIVLFALAAATGASARANDFASHFVATDPPKSLPVLSFEDAAGRTLNLKDFQGRYVLLNLWATWCAPCTHEISALNVLQDQFASRPFTVIALTEDSSGIAAARGFYDRHDIRHLTVYADAAGAVPSLLHARGLPTSFLIDPEGREIGLIEGEADWAAPDAVAFLAKRMNP
jgi:peroxiredoxin